MTGKNQQALRAWERLSNAYSGFYKYNLPSDIALIEAALAQPEVDVEALKREALEFILRKLSNREADHPRAVEMWIDHLASRGLLGREGFVSVPVEPTAVMVNAAFHSVEDDETWRSSPKKPKLREFYKAMIAAAQKEGA